MTVFTSGIIKKQWKILNVRSRLFYHKNHYLSFKHKFLRSKASYFSNAAFVGNNFFKNGSTCALCSSLACSESFKQKSLGLYLSIFLWGAGAPILLFTPLGQPTNLGFATFGCGLCLSAAVAKTK